MTQVTLSADQIAAFYHDEFVEDQVRDFAAMVEPSSVGEGVVVDVGGGCGFFARRLRELRSFKVRVLDTDPVSVAACHGVGVDAMLGDALQPPRVGDERIVAFNLILHHLVASSEQATRELQRRALAVWAARAQAVFVNEYIYESYLRNFSGWAIFQITKSQLLSWFARLAASIIPAFRANTFGVGVRFRAHDEWLKIFAAAGYQTRSVAIGKPEPVAAPLRLLLIRTIRRDSFLLEPKR